MDAIDAKILTELQKDSTRSIADIAEQVGTSTSACHRRIKALEKAGLITGYAAQIDPRAIGLSIHAFVEIRLSDQSQQSMDAFENAANAFDEILSCHLLSGDFDYLIRVAARDFNHFDQIHRERLAKLPNVSSMKSSFSIREVKPWSGYPIYRAS